MLIKRGLKWPFLNVPFLKLMYRDTRKNHTTCYARRINTGPTFVWVWIKIKNCPPTPAPFPFITSPSPSLTNQISRLSVEFKGSFGGKLYVRNFFAYAELFLQNWWHHWVPKCPKPRNPRKHRTGPLQGRFSLNARARAPSSCNLVKNGAGAHSWAN